MARLAVVPGGGMGVGGVGVGVGVGAGVGGDVLRRVGGDCLLYDVLRVWRPICRRGDKECG